METSNVSIWARFDFKIPIPKGDHKELYLDIDAGTGYASIILMDNDSGDIITRTDLPIAGSDAGLLSADRQYIDGPKIFQGYATFQKGHGDSSDIRKKESLKKIENSEDILQALTGYKFTYTDSGKKSIGIIAQDIQKVLPELVHEDENGFLSVEYSPLIAVLIEDNKKMRAIISEMKTDMESIKKALL